MWRSHPMARSSSIDPAGCAAAVDRSSVRGVNELEPRLLAGTANARYPIHLSGWPWVGFHAGTEIRKGGDCRRTSHGRLPHRVGATRRELGRRRLHRIRLAGWPAACACERRRAEGVDRPSMRASPSSTYCRTCCRVASGWSSPSFPGTRLPCRPPRGHRDRQPDSGSCCSPAGHDAAYVDSGHLIYGLTSGSPDAESRFRASLRAVRFDPVRVEVDRRTVSVVDPVRSERRRR